jgi:hypothetical protein
MRYRINPVKAKTVAETSPYEIDERYSDAAMTVIVKPAFSIFRYSGRRPGELDLADSSPRLPL